MRLVGPLFIALGLISLFTSCFAVFKEFRYYSGSIVTTGVVEDMTSQDITKMDANNEPVTVTVYTGKASFKTYDGSEYKIKVSGPEYADGDSVAIEYFEDNPDSARLNDGSISYKAPLGYLLIGFVLLGLGVFSVKFA